jgi:hypothetical protein
VSPSTPKLILVAVLLVSLLGRGIAKRAATWSSAEWARLSIQLVMSVALVALPLFMATEVDLGLTHGWSAVARALYLTAMLLMLLYGVVSGVRLLTAFAGDSVPPKLYHGYLMTFVVVVIALGVAAYLDEAASVPFERSSAGVLGAFCLFLGARLPEWVKAHPLYAFTSGIVGELGTRLFYGAVGGVFIAAALFGHAAHLLR